MEAPQGESPAAHKQTVSIVDGKPFVTTELIRTDIKGKEFVTFSHTAPYQGSLDDYKAELETAKAEEIDRHTKTIADADDKLAAVETAIGNPV